jgi:hypothetical protein
MTRKETIERTASAEAPIRLGNQVDIIPIDGVLDLYTPGTQQIVVFR